MVQNWIGAYQFVTLSRPPTGITPGTRLMTRPGVAGVAMWLTAERGRPFVLRSGLDTVNYGLAIFTYKLYRTLVGTNPTRLIQGNVSWTDEDTKILVLDVLPAGEEGIRALIGGVGGLNYPSQGFLECDWTLCFVDVS
jgi:hypothetical protein